MHGAAVAHGVVRVAILGGTARSTDHLSRTGEICRVQEPKIVAELVGVDERVVPVAVVPCLTVTDVGQASPAAHAEVGEDVETVLVVGKVVTGGRRRGISTAADARPIA